MFRCGNWRIVVGKLNFVKKDFEFTELVNGIGDREGRIDFGVRVFA